MCEYSPNCTKTTEPLAKALSENPREDLAVVLVLCPQRYHLLAAVYDQPALGGLVLCTPHMKARHGSLFKPHPDVDPNKIVHWHASLQSLRGYAENETVYGRCRCGTWHYKPARALEEVQRVQSGTWTGIRRDTFVKVRSDATGRVSELPRKYAVAHVIPKGGHTIIGRSPRSDRLRRPYILSSHVQMADAPAREQHARE